ncbi:hypothetical protein KKC08_05370 [Patescibacteria group bacterium]|nr:hypothetical protein [Patescibacteria group bacterium]MCG2701916.1 hypothetical protein [Candidatus Parcubacteria bacterium]MBU4265189.1 hypothetical protein [Patescibacteria group bacterium]MBU4390753.1 hypothetical protein [Patescibacteria group bacterium]MBU4397568.1 hypothetical protein [Patescibacteria group bacterium]
MPKVENHVNRLTADMRGNDWKVEDGQESRLRDRFGEEMKTFMPWLDSSLFGPWTDPQTICTRHTNRRKRAQLREMNEKRWTREIIISDDAVDDFVVAFDIMAPDEGKRIFGYVDREGNFIAQFGKGGAFCMVTMQKSN